MHDLDRTQLEIGEEFETFDGGYDTEATYDYEPEFDMEAVFDPSEEMELAAELISVTSDEELDQFLGKWIKKAAHAAGKVLSTPQFKAIGGMLKGVAKKALPLAGTAIGGFFGGPVGAKIGGGLGRVGASLIKEVALQGYAPEDREFEVARRLIQLGGKAVQKLASMPPSAHPAAAAHKAIAHAVRTVAPTAAHAISSMAGGHTRSGRWVRKGRNIVVLGAA